MKCKMGHRWNYQQRDEDGMSFRVCRVCKLLQGKRQRSGKRWVDMHLPKVETPAEVG